jgi:hypothetical protein
MKWVCLMANMTVPGVGSLIVKRYWAGAIQSGVSLIGIAMFGYCFMAFYDALQVYAASMDEPENMAEILKGLGAKMTQPLIIGGVGLLIFKVMWIWAQVTTARVFKAEKEAEAKLDATKAVAADQTVPPLLDSSN